MIERYEIDAPDRMLTIWAESNTRAMSAVPDGRQTVRRRAMRPVVDRFLEREGAGEIRWCGVTLPTAAQAQQAGMAVADYEQFVYNAAHLDDPDPVAHWRVVSARQAEVCDRLSSVRELRIVAEGTDLTVDVGGRKWINADGHENFPDGEVFTSPVEANTQGHIALLVRRALRRAARWAAYGCGSRTGWSSARRPIGAATSCARCSIWTRDRGSWARSRSG